jgi:tetratricopeptide (TPR) repeat protein
MRLFFVFLFSVFFLQISAQTVYENSSEKTDSIVFSKIPYDSLVAKTDIENGIVRIVNLSCSGQVEISPEEIEQIESRFGFQFYYDCLELPYEYLVIKQKEYNRIVYKYLDSLYNIDSEAEIFTEQVQLYSERIIASEKTDNEIEKNIRKSIKRENKEIKKQIYQADLLYRDRKFEEALNIYNKIESNNEMTISYVTNSKYHCLMNLKQYDKARQLLDDNVSRIKKGKK